MIKELMHDPIFLAWDFRGSNASEYQVVELII